MKPEEVFRSNIESWGKRSVYNLSIEEMLVMLDSPHALVVCRNKDNGDGTYFTELIYNEKRFATSSAEII